MDNGEGQPEQGILPQEEKGKEDTREEEGEEEEGKKGEEDKKEEEKKEEGEGMMRGRKKSSLLAYSKSNICKH